LRNLLRSGSLAATLALVVCLAAPSAHAGTYTVDSCRSADGQPAPTDGWARARVPTVGYADMADTCSTGGSLRVEMYGDRSHLNFDVMSMTFKVGVPGLQLRSARLWRWAKVEAMDFYAVLGSYISAPDEIYGATSFIDRQYGAGELGVAGTPLANANVVEVPADHAGTPEAYINFSLFCSTQADIECRATPGRNKAELRLYRAAIQLDDVAPPVLTRASGDLLVGDRLSGTATGSLAWAVDASDVGSGLLRAVVMVDGREAATGTFGDPRGRCPQGVARVYQYRVPCPASGKATLRWDTTTVEDGEHEVSVLVEDASGERTLAASGTVKVANVKELGPGAPLALRGAPNGSVDTDTATLSLLWPESAVAPRTDRATVRRCARSPRFAEAHRDWCSGRPASSEIVGGWSSKKSWALTGRLTTPGGVPIVGATVQVRATLASLGAPDVVVAEPTTGAAGDFTLPFARTGGSQRIEVRWRARRNDTVDVARASASLNLRTATTLRAPKRVGAGRRVTFSGQLLGLAGLLTSVPITLEVRADGRWKTFAATATGDGGTWSVTLPFARTRGRYEVRAKVGAAATYPWAPGASRESVRIRVV
jgi:hypothetical protein